MSVKRIPYYPLLAILFSIFAYVGTVHYDFIADDIAGIVNNKNLQDLSLVLAHYNGIMWALVRHINYLMGGAEPFYFHLTNIFLHALNVFLVYILVSVTSNRRLAFYTAGLFAVHPIATEVVTWISGGSYTLYASFLLGSLLTFILARKTNNLIWYTSSLALFVCCVLTSEKAIVLLPILFAYSYFHGRLQKDFFFLMPYIVGGIVLILLYIPFVAYRLSAYTHVFALSSEVSNPYILIPVAFATYLQLLIWPVGFTLYHVEPVTTMGYLVSYLVVLLYAISLYLSYKHNKRICFWLSFFVLSLLPVLTPLRLASFVAERYVYVGAIGIFWCFSYVLTLLERQYLSGKKGMIIFISIIIILMSITQSRNSDWKDGPSFWAATVESSPHSYQAHYNLGVIYLERKELQPAVRELLASVQLKSNYDLGYQSLGYAYQLNGMNEDALASYKMAVKLNSRLWPSYKNMGAIYLAKEEYDKAVEMATKAIAQDKNNPDLYTNLGIIYLKKGDKQEAKKQFEVALIVDPNFSKAAYGLSLTK